MKLKKLVWNTFQAHDWSLTDIQILSSFNHFCTILMWLNCKIHQLSKIDLAVLSTSYQPIKCFIFWKQHINFLNVARSECIISQLFQFYINFKFTEFPWIFLSVLKSWTGVWGYKPGQFRLMSLKMIGYFTSSFDRVQSYRQSINQLEYRKKKSNMEEMGVIGW